MAIVWAVGVFTRQEALCAVLPSMLTSVGRKEAVQIARALFSTTADLEIFVSTGTKCDGELTRSLLFCSAEIFSGHSAVSPISWFSVMCRCCEWDASTQTLWVVLHCSCKQRLFSKLSLARAFKGSPPLKNGLLTMEKRRTDELYCQKVWSERPNTQAVVKKDAMVWIWFVLYIERCISITRVSLNTSRYFSDSLKKRERKKSQKNFI